MKLPKIYYGYKKLRSFWERQPESNTEKHVMIMALTESMQDIINGYMENFERELYE